MSDLKEIRIIIEDRWPRWLPQKQAMVYAGFSETSRAAFLKWAAARHLSVRRNGKPIYDRHEIDAARRAEMITFGGIGEDV